MKVWCSACSANFQAQLALYEAEIAYTKLDERVQREDPTLTDEEHESIVRTINQQYRDAFRHVTHALPRRLKPRRQTNGESARYGEHSINVSHLTHAHTAVIMVVSVQLSQQLILWCCLCLLMM